MSNHVKFCHFLSLAGPCRLLSFSFVIKSQIMSNNVKFCHFLSIPVFSHTPSLPVGGLTASAEASPCRARRPGAPASVHSHLLIFCHKWQKDHRRLEPPFPAKRASRGPHPCSCTKRYGRKRRLSALSGKSRARRPVRQEFELPMYSLFAPKIFRCWRNKISGCTSCCIQGTTFRFTKNHVQTAAG